MQINGAWRLCDDQVMRPLILGSVRTVDGSWIEVPFLADCGADRTVLSCDVWQSLRLPSIESSDGISGLGGSPESVLVQTHVRLERQDGVQVHFKGIFAAVTSPSALDMCVLGRDVTNLFALLVDCPILLVSMVRDEHACVIVKR
jgi:hypothetical protein